MTTAIAQTIAQQIGKQALFMLGAKNLVASENALTFKVGRNAKRVTHIKVELNGYDLYDITYYKITNRGLNVIELHTSTMVYFDQLHADFEAQTGMYTKL